MWHNGPGRQEQKSIVGGGRLDGPLEHRSALRQTLDNMDSHEEYLHESTGRVKILTISSRQ